MNSLSLMDWHQRYLEQARWTASVRRFLCKMANLNHSHRILEVGSGTGAFLGEVAADTGAEIIGVDISIKPLQFAQRQVSAKYVGADGLSLPFSNQTFDAGVCHFLLLWVSDPLAILKEIRRVVCPGSAVIAFGEPDYGGRIDHPKELEALGEAQTQALISQGADPMTGRKLKSLFIKSGLINVFSGVLGGEWAQTFNKQAWFSEWSIVNNDLQNRMPDMELSKYRSIDKAAWERGERLLFIPTFYALGWKPV